MTIHTQLHQRGWTHIQNIDAQRFLQIAKSLGKIIHSTDVAIKPDSRGLVTSNKPLDFHTDHSKANFVTWRCINSDASGGNTILADSWAALEKLNNATKKILRTVMLKEHLMFSDDPAQTPLLSGDEDAPKIYYSFWLANKNMPPPQRRAFDEFRRAVNMIKFTELKLKPNDVLIVNNSRILHGRREIADPSRRLLRLWIQSFNQT